MVKVKKCDVETCAYNKDKECHAMAITVGSSHPMCDTFTSSMNKGGVDEQGSVGACRVSNCMYNKSLQCNAPGIDVGMHSGHADCNTFKPGK